MDSLYGNAVKTLLRGARLFDADIADAERRLRACARAMEDVEKRAEKVRFPGQYRTLYIGEMNEVLSQRSELARRTIARLRADQALLERMTGILPEMEHRVIRMRWFEGRSWQYVAQHVYISVRQGQRLQARAIVRMEEIYREALLEPQYRAARDIGGAGVYLNG